MLVCVVRWINAQWYMTGKATAVAMGLSNLRPVKILQNTFSDRARCIAQLRPGSSFLLSALRFHRHDYDGVAEDLRAWWPKLKAGGLLCGDDWAEVDGTYEIKQRGKVTPTKFAVRGAVDAFIAARDVGLHLVADPPMHTFWLFKPLVARRPVPAETRACAPEALPIAEETKDGKEGEEEQSTAAFVTLVTGGARGGYAFGAPVADSAEHFFSDRTRALHWHSYGPGPHPC